MALGAKESQTACPCDRRITVLNRPKLETLSCECYAAAKKETDRLRSPHALF
jgi:hypothetical protein